MTASLPAPCSIVIVDDDPDDRFLTERLLAKAGVHARTISAAGGNEAMALLEKEPPAEANRLVLLLDLKMPFPDGFEVTRWLRAKKSLRDVKVVILTNSDDPHDRRRALELGADRYLVKNPTPREIAAVFREILQR